MFAAVVCMAHMWKSERLKVPDGLANEIFVVEFHEASSSCWQNCFRKRWREPTRVDARRAAADIDSLRIAATGNLSGAE